MKLPNHSEAIIGLVKLRDYILNPDDPRGKHKARVFARVLGFDPNDAVDLINRIRAGLNREESRR